MKSARPTRILILGGGFGVVHTALTLEKLLARELRAGGLDLGLVRLENYRLFQPMLPEVLSGSIGILDTITPIRRLCPRTNLYTRTIEKIDLDRRCVSVAAGFGSQHRNLPFDHLVIALGNVTSFAGQPGLAEHALPFKYLGDALAVRNRIIHTLEEAAIERDPEMRRTLLTFVVAGGGFSGVEAVAEINDFVRAAAGSFRNLPKDEIRVILLHGGPLILPELPQSLAEFAQRLLMKRGVDIRLDTRLAGATAEAALLAGGDRIATRTLVSTVPSMPNPLVAMLDGKMGSLGHHSAVAEVFGLKISGFLAWWLWRTVYLMKLPGLDRKIRVATDWTLDLILRPDIVQLKTDKPVGIRREHFEPGQVVFREGDRGDWLYVVVDGEVEVLKTIPDRGETCLRTLGPGECFGEIALVSDRPRSATVRSLGNVNLLAVDREAFQALFSNLPPLRGFFEQLIDMRNR